MSSASCLVFLILLMSASCAHCCDYSKCEVGLADVLNIYLLPHSHSDTGWDKTVDEYFYGHKNYIQNVGMQYNLDAIMQALYFNPKRRFTWIEVAYLWRWWYEKDDFMKNVTRQLLKEGRLMFSNNAWSMNEEGSCYYQEIVDQHTLGQEFLMREFGQCGLPLSAWQIDTWGHTTEMANLLALMGHDSVYYSRLDYQDKAKRWKERSMQFLWQARPEASSQKNTIYASFFQELYLPPAVVNFAWSEPIMDDPRLYGNNVERIVQQFIEKMVEWSGGYPTGHIPLTMGTDFQYENANRWFLNMDRLIKHVNAYFETHNVTIPMPNGTLKSTKMHLQYSTAPCYTFAVHSNQVALSKKLDDFFPVAHQPHTFWTGTFTSRPNMKAYVRDSNAFLQTCKQLSVLWDSATSRKNRQWIQTQIDFLRQSMGTDVNHGQFPGTQKQLVAFDNALRLSNGSLECMKVVDAAYSSLKGFHSAVNSLSELCSLLNITECRGIEAAQPGEFKVTYYNSLSRTIEHLARIPVLRTSSRISVIVNDHEVPFQLIPVSQRTKSIPERESKATFELVHLVDLPPIGFQTVYYKVDTSNKEVTEDNLFFQSVRPITTGGRKSARSHVTNGHLTLLFDPKTPVVRGLVDHRTQKQYMLSFDLRYYTPMLGDCSSPDKQPEGVFIFRPVENRSVLLPPPQMEIINGSLVTEIRFTYTAWASLVLRMFHNSKNMSNVLEVEWTAGPLPMSSTKVGRDLVLHYNTSLKSVTTSPTFFTDSNGRQMMERRANYRRTWQFNNTEPVAGNFFPVTSMSYLEDTITGDHFTVITDRSQSVSSLYSGEMEFLLHRRLGVDDCLGTDEALNETGKDGEGLIARGRHWIFFGDKVSSGKQMRLKNQEMQMRPTVTVQPGQQQGLHSKENLIFSALSKALPENVHLMTLEPFRDDRSYLLRLEHVFDINEDAKLSQNVSVDLTTLFQGKQLIEAEEVTLSGAQPLSKLVRLQWNIATIGANGIREKDLDPKNVLLAPMDIRTFRIVLQ